MNRRLALLASSSVITLALCGCLGNSGSPMAPPTDVAVYPGDAAVSITWNDVPSVQYWLFYAQDPTVTPFNLDNNNTPLLNFGYTVPASSPTILCNGLQHTIINQSLSVGAGFPAYYFTINARTGTAKGGPGSPPVSGVPRPAAGNNAPWTAGASIPATVNALGYIPLTSCGYSGLPPQGIFYAVGPAGAIYSSTLAPTVAGPLTNPGNQAMTWTQGTVPAGFSSNLNAVAGRAGNGNAPENPNLLVVAVGDDGAILRTLDGTHWQQSNPVATGNVLQSGNLHDVAVSGGGFVAVGDAGLVLTSSDGLNWTASSSAQAANPAGSALRAIHCAGATCVAVGDSGTTLWTFSSGASWILVPFGTNNWKNIAYGDANANSDAVYFAGTFNLANEAISTWVVVDADGNYGYYSPATNGRWVAGPSIIASDIVSIDYTTHFVALDVAGNAWISEQGAGGNWATYSSAQLATNGAHAIAIRSNGLGFVALGASGANAASF